MKSPLLHPIPWLNGPKSYHRRLFDQDFLFCLYSGTQERFSYVGCNPLCQVKFFPRHLEWKSKTTRQHSFQNPFEWMKLHLSSLPPAESPFFSSGWIGFFGYEMGPFADAALPHRQLKEDFLLGMWGLYDPVLVFDHVQQKGWIASLGLNEEEEASPARAQENIDQFKEILKSPEAQATLSSDLHLHSLALQSDEGKPLQINIKASLDGNSLILNDSCYTIETRDSNFSRRDYEATVQKIIDYLHAGDCYQVNLSQQLSFKDLSLSKSALVDLFWSLAYSHPAPFSACMDLEDLQILSLSPEAFLTLKDNRLVTRPIKGTRPRGKTEEEDRRLIQELKNSSKEKSELLMIVDLVRNDLGKVCFPGSIEVTSLQAIESWDYVHHQVATIMGELKPDAHPLDAVQALFPGGSITGAPKRRAMEIIQELEPDPRGVYTGIMGWMDRNALSLNIAIRTLEIRNGHARLGVGGGIVADSDPAAEYEETLIKAQSFIPRKTRTQECEN